MIGTTAAILTTISFVPQAYQVIKTKDTSGISLGMYIAFVLGCILMDYSWYQNSGYELNWCKCDYFCICFYYLNLQN